MKTYVQQNEHLADSASQLAHALGLNSHSAQKAIKKFQVREIADSEQVFTFTAKSNYVPARVGRGLLSAEDVAELTGVSLATVKTYLSQPYGWHLPNGIYSCVVQNWKFKEMD